MKQKRTEVCSLGRKRVAGCNRYANAAEEEAETMSKQKDGREGPGWRQWGRDTDVKREARPWSVSLPPSLSFLVSIPR